jgi:uncharacterized protein YdeI (BOF family)
MNATNAMNAMNATRRSLRARRSLLALPLALALALGCGSQELEETASRDDVQAETAPDATWVALTGTVVDAQEDRFLLDYGEDVITVEMDDWDAWGDAVGLLPNDEVVVYGRIDDDFFERRTIEAGSVYVRDLGTYFYANAVDEEDVPMVAVVDFEPRIELSGVVTSVRGRELELDTGAGVVDVSTRTMPYDPLDDEGFQQVDVGDRVRVSGELGRDLFDDLALMAQTIVSSRTAEDAEEPEGASDGEASAQDDEDTA